MNAARLALGLVAVAAAGLGLFVFGMRHKSSPIVAGMRRVNRRLFNPVQLKSAGDPGAFAAVLRHTGRTSGTHYATPIGAVPCADGFVVGLVYGRQTDWLMNVMAGGPAQLHYEGSEHIITGIDIKPIAAHSESFSTSDRRSQRLFGVREVAVLHTT